MLCLLCNIYYKKVVYKIKNFFVLYKFIFIKIFYLLVSNIIIIGSLCSLSKYYSYHSNINKRNKLIIPFVWIN